MYFVGLKYHWNQYTACTSSQPTRLKGLERTTAWVPAANHGDPVLSPRTATGGPMPGETLSAVSTGMQVSF
jgi:hypothetical protein